MQESFEAMGRVTVSELDQILIASSSVTCAFLVYHSVGLGLAIFSHVIFCPLSPGFAPRWHPDALKNPLKMIKTAQQKPQVD